MKRLLLIMFAMLPAVGLGDSGQGIKPAPLQVTTQDGSVKGWPYKLIFPNGSLTNNNDGTMTVNFGGVVTNSFLLIETGDSLLLETGDKLILE